MTNNTKTHPTTVMILIALHILLGIGAVGGGGAFILAPDGSLMGMPISFLDNSPFTDFLIPGVILFTLLGVFPLAVAYSLWTLPAWRWPDTINPFKQSHWSWAASLATGVILMIWITVQVSMIALGFLHVLYFCWGAVIVFLSSLPTVRRYCAKKT